MEPASVTKSEGGRTEWELPSSRGRWRILASILGPVTWLSFTLHHVGFWTTGSTRFQSGIVILVSEIVLGGVMGAIGTS